MAKDGHTECVIQSLCHALSLLEQFQEVDELGVTELSKRLNLAKNNVFRLLATLESRNYVEQNRLTQNYRLGLKTLELGQTFVKQMGLLQHARPMLEALAKECNETSYVAILRDYRTVYLDFVETSLTVRVVPRVGARLPAYCTATGKVQIASMTNDYLANFHPTKKMTRYTPNTVTDLEELRTHLEVVAEQGYALEDEEMELGVKCVGAPIRDYTGRVIGAVSISGPSMRFTNRRLEKELIPLVICYGERISFQLGYHK